ncbi:DUF3592 domain-containing protein [Streptomyces sp. NPDC101151]|uniref:DUF3592 domain-containing protein n=1 Tax=Streptomyces sp. NPDC101151 TaxID=3366115 RepID=UPI00380CF84E
MDTGPGRLRRSGGALACGAAALLLLTLTLVVCFPAAWQRVAAQGGTEATGTFHDGGEGCFFGGCQVEFTVAGERVVAELPAGTSAEGRDTGDTVVVRYVPGEPQRAALADDVGTADVALLLALPGGSALVALLAAMLWWRRLSRPAQAV